MKCPKCEERGVTSKVDMDECGAVTLMAHRTFYDEDANFHCHDPNRINTYGECSEGHSLCHTSYTACWCGWAAGEESLRAYDPTPPSVNGTITIELKTVEVNCESRKLDMGAWGRAFDEQYERRIQYIEKHGRPHASDSWALEPEFNDPDYTATPELLAHMRDLLNHSKANPRPVTFVMSQDLNAYHSVEAEEELRNLLDAEFKDKL